MKPHVTSHFSERLICAKQLDLTTGHLLLLLLDEVMLIKLLTILWHIANMNYKKLVLMIVITDAMGNKKEFQILLFNDVPDYTLRLQSEHLIFAETKI